MRACVSGRWRGGGRKGILAARMERTRQTAAALKAARKGLPISPCIIAATARRLAGIQTQTHGRIQSV